MKRRAASASSNPSARQQRAGRTSPSLLNAEWSGERRPPSSPPRPRSSGGSLDGASDSSPSGSSGEPPRGRKAVAGSTAVAFSYRDFDEEPPEGDARRDFGSGSLLMKTNFSEGGRGVPRAGGGGTSRRPSAGSLVSVEVLRELLDGSARSAKSSAGRSAGSRDSPKGALGGRSASCGDLDGFREGPSADDSPAADPEGEDGGWRPLRSLSRLPLFKRVGERFSFRGSRGEASDGAGSEGGPRGGAARPRGGRGASGSVDGRGSGAPRGRRSARSRSAGSDASPTSGDGSIGESIDDDRKQRRAGRKSGSGPRRSSRRSDDGGGVRRSLRRSVSSKSFRSGACCSSSSAGSASEGVDGRRKKPSDDDAARPQDESAESQSDASRSRSPKRSSSSKSHHRGELTENLHQNESMESPRQSVSSLPTKNIPIPASAQQKMSGLGSSLKENEKRIIFGHGLFHSHSDGEANPSKAIKRDKIRRRASDPVSPILSIRTTVTTLTSFSCEPRPTSLGEEKMDPAVQTGRAEDEFASAASKGDGDTLQSAISAMIELKRQADESQPNSVAVVPSAQRDIPMHQTNAIGFSPSRPRKLPSVQHAHSDVPESSSNDIKNIRPAGPLQRRAASDANHEKGRGPTVPKKPLYRRISCGEATVPSNRPLSSDFVRYVLEDGANDRGRRVDDASDSDEEQSVRLSIREDFKKAVRRGSFQRSMTSSTRSGDFDVDVSAAALSLSDEVQSDDELSEEDKIKYQVMPVLTKQSGQEEIEAESSVSRKPKRNSRMRRRPTEESGTTAGRSAVSSLDSYASPIDFARARQVVGRNQAPNVAPAALPQPLPPLKREKSERSVGSMSSLGEESVFRQMTNYQSDQINRTEEAIPTINEHEDDNPRKLARSYLENEVKSSNVSIAEEDLDTSRRDHHHNEFEQSSITLGTFFSEIQGTHISEDDGYLHISTGNNCDLDSGITAFAIAMRLGHFDCHDEVMANVNTENDDDECLAAKAFMGLGFAGQQKGENESALDSYRQSLQLWESKVGSEHPSLACLHYTIGTVLSQERNELEASVHFNNALSLLMSNKTINERIRASILSTEGMIFSVVGEARRALDCFKRALSIYQKLENPLNLNYSLIMYEMGTLLAQQGDLGDAVSCYKFALDIREKKLGSSFVVMQTHYSLGVTLAQIDSSSSMDYALIHLEKALSLCGDDTIQAPTIIHAIGVLCEKKGDFHAATSWFYRELNTVKSLFGDDDERVGMCSSDVGSSFFHVGKYGIAIELFEQALRILLQVTEEEQSHEVADILYKIASCHEVLCEYDEALGIFEEVKQIRQTLTGRESSPVIKTMLRIGNVYLSKGEAQMALECFNEIVGIGFASDTINEIEVANALYGRGCAQYCLFHLSDAMKSLNESLNWKLAALGEDDPGLACIFYQMAHVYLEQSEKENAIMCFEEYSRLLKIDTQKNLQDNAEICQTAGIVCKLKGELDNALGFYSQALNMFQALFGNQQYHEKLATIHFDIGCILAFKGDNKEALRQLQLCLAMRKKLLGSHADVATVLYEMAVILQQEGMTAPAVMCLEESDSIWKAKLGCSEKLISVCHASAKLWKLLLRYREAEGNFEQALEFAITLYGQRHDTVATILLDLGELLHEIGQYEQAVFCYDEALDVRKQLFGPDDPKVASILYCKGVALLFQGNFDEAYDCLNSSLVIRQDKLGDVDEDVGDTLNTIGFLQLRKGNIAEDAALGPLTKALEIRRALENKSKVVTTLQNMASLYKKRKEFDLCMEIHSEILAVRQNEFGTNDDKVADAWINLGNIQTTAGRMVEATISYEEALRIRTLSGGNNHKSVAHVLFKLGMLNSRQGNYANAKQLFEEYIRLRAEEEDDPDQEMAQALTLIGDIQLDTGEKSKAQINWTSAMEIYLNLGYTEDHPKVAKLKSRQKTVPGWFSSSHLGGIYVSRVASDLSSVVDAPLSLFSRLTTPSELPTLPDSQDDNKCVNH